MSLRIQQLNADTTFLLTFSPPYAPEISKRYPGDFVILIDPWLKGHSSILHPTFQISHHTSTPALYSLNELNQRPDLIIVSQDKPDHCHRETLCSLPRDTLISILATPAAARKIRSWNYFEEDIVQIITPYDACDQESIARIPLEGFTSLCGEGEITIANVPTKRDVTGLHNAIGITYQPASTVLTQSLWSCQDVGGFNSTALPGREFSSAPASPQRSQRLSSNSPGLSNESLGVMSAPEMGQSPSYYTNGSLTKPMFREKVLSVLYTPHGISTPHLEPYILHHLDTLNALPVSALFHSLTMESNPWFMGGVVAKGAPGGVDIAKRFGTKYWIGAHDEPKENKGMATVFLKTKQYDADDAESLLNKNGLQQTKVYQLDVGEVLRIPELTKSVERAKRLPRPRKKGLRMSMRRGQRMNIEDNVLAMPEPKMSLTTPNPSGGNEAIAPGTRIRIRREITDPLGRWI